MLMAAFDPVDPSVLSEMGAGLLEMERHPRRDALFPELSLIHIYATGFSRKRIRRQPEKKLKGIFQTLFRLIRYDDVKPRGPAPFPTGGIFMPASPTVFKRMELKYRLTGDVFQPLYAALQDYADPDAYGRDVYKRQILTWIP